MAVPVWAENVVYDGDTTKLQAIPNSGGSPDTFEGSVAPSGSANDPNPGKSPSLANNTVTVTNGAGVQHVFGAVNTFDAGAVTNNKVIIDGATMTDVTIFGGWSPSGVTGNSVDIINGANVTGTVFGGYFNLASGSSLITITNNSVAVSDSTVTGIVTGGFAGVKSGDGSATAKDNSVDIADSWVIGGVYGGNAASDSGTATASNNKVTIRGLSSVVGSFGGVAYSDSGAATASDNSVTISDAAQVLIVGGGYASSSQGNATASGNIVNISGGTVENSVISGDAASSYGAATASNNKVTISGIIIEDGNVFGGYADSNTVSSTASGNTVTIGGISIVNGNVYGGEANVIVATVFDEELGDFVEVGGDGNATASNNNVTISGEAQIQLATGGGAALVEGNGSATATNNSVTISGLSVLGGNVYGGEAVSGDGTATASNNIVDINGGTVKGYVYGGEAYSSEGNATASANSVTISDGTVGGNVFGGYADSDGAGMSGEASNNKVTISGGMVGGDIYGGFSRVDGYGETGSAIGNTVTISGAPDLSASNLYGGFVGDYGAPVTGMDAFTGNTLNTLNYSGSSVQSVQNFQYYNFTFPVTQGDTPVLSVTNTATLGNSIVTANTVGGGAPLRPGDQVTLIGAGTLNATDFTQAQAQGQHGATLSYLWNLNTDDNMLTATLGRVQTNPQTKVLSEGFLSGMALVNQGADLVAGKGLRDAMLSSSIETGYGVFGSLSGGWSQYDTGSHLEMSSISLLTGVSRGADLNPGRLTLGAFFEYGSGSYDTYNDFSGIDFNGDGDVRHFGGGIIGRMDFADTGAGHAYTEGSFRVGTINNEYSNANLRDFLGRSAGGYDSDSAYYGLHAGLGYIGNLSETISFDLYGKYFWTRVQGDDITLATGESVSFKDADSHRVRVGTRFTYAEDKTYTHYVGLAYEHEFDGEADAAIFGYAIDSPDIGGGTGIGEIGMHINPTDNPGLFLDLGIQGYLGTREGMTGSVQIRYEF